MKYDHLIKHNGAYYKAGEDGPESSPALVDEKEVPKGALDTHEDGSVNTYDEDGDLTGTINPETVAEAQEEAGKHFTRTEISRMPVAELKEYAASIGIEVTEESTGTKLKEQIIAKLGL